MTDAKRIAFLGLGVMGAPMAGHLARAGHRVTVYNRTAAKADDWVARHAAEGLEVASAPTPADAAQGQDVVVTCVGNDDDLAEVVLGEAGALAAMAPGALLVDHTTVSPALARRINNALLRADQIHHAKNGQRNGNKVHWLVPLVADAEAGFGGVLHAYEIMQAMIREGVAAVHFEDQLASVKKCGHLGGKVIVPTQEFITKLVQQTEQSLAQPAPETAK